MTLKIQKVEGETGVVLKLSGRIEKENLADLRRVCEPLGNGNLVLDLEEVKLVDRDAVDFLDRCEADGVRLRNCPAYIRHWINQDHKGQS